MNQNPEFIVIHDTDIAGTYKEEQLAIVNGVHERRWGMQSPTTGMYVCYHYFIGRNGTTVQTRADNERPGCTMSIAINNDSIQIVMAGDFENEEPTPMQEKSLMKLVSDLQKKYGIRSDHVIGHTEASPTRCPGKNMMAVLYRFRRLNKIPEIQNYREYGKTGTGILQD